ncbi:MAG: hypothetical protein KIT09_32385 [Bryobacteraceae bacterium]|nr:hypothetical protein [Bryobacteraceae bacterium]
MRCLWFFCLTAFVFAGQTPAPDCSAVAGWTQQGPVRTFVPDDLFEYMNGNAEGYILYDFERMTGVTCASGEDTILIDISEMRSPEMAYGMFSANKHQTAEVIKIGVAGQVTPRKATFVKGPYYVELAANPAKDHTPALEAYVASLEPKLAGTTERPLALHWFPAHQLEEGSVRLVPQSVLGLRILARGYVATYAYGRAFVVPEASAEAATALLAKFKARVSDAAPAEIADEGFTGADRYLGKVCVARNGAYVIGLVNIKEGDGKAQAAALAANVR